MEEDQLARLVEFTALRKADVERVDASIPANHGNILIGTIAELRDQDCYEWMRFKKAELMDLLPRMRLPEFFELTIDERTWELPGEFVFMFSLTRLCKGLSYNDLHIRFGSNRDFMGSFFYLFIRHVFCHFFHKISGNSMGMWLEEKPDYFRRLIWEKARQPTGNEERRFADGLIGEMQTLEVPFDEFRPFAYIDNTNVKTCRPGAGPV